MNERISDQWLENLAASFRYPATPDVAEDVRRRLSQPRPGARFRSTRLAWVVLAFLLLAAALLAVPGVRAAVLEFLQIGAVRILPIEGTANPAATPPTRSLLDLAGATTWEDAQDSARFPLRLPSYPQDLGLPDEVYQQQLWDPGMDQPVFILVWRDPVRPDEVRLALYHIALPYYGLKSAALSALAETQVDGELAYWVRGPHRLKLRNGEMSEWLFVKGNVLIWVEGGITYRLEGAASMEDAVRIAESLEPR